MSKTDLTLSQFLKNLHEEIDTAAMNAASADRPLLLSELEIEFLVSAEQTKGNEGGVQFWVLSGKANKSNKDAQTQRVKLKLIPQKPIPLGNDEKPKF